MSGYLSLTFTAPGGAIAAPLRSLFATAGFRPVALGAAAGSGAERSWLLAGYALESFVAPAMLRGLGVPESVVLCAEGREDVGSYLEQLLTAPEHAPSSLSPFEHRAGEATYLDGVQLDPAVLQQLDSWSAGRPQARATLYGAVALAAPRTSKSDDVFRLLMPPDANVAAAPFVSIRSEQRDSVVELSLFSETAVWLRSGDRSDRESDANLAQLAAIAAALRATAAGPGVLHIEGTRFERDAERLQAALADSVEHFEVGW